MKKLLLAFTLVIGVLSFNGCSDATSAAISALGSKHIITLYGCDGKVIQQWTSTGKINNEEHSNGYYFKDEKTGKLVMVDGTVVITVE